MNVPVEVVEEAIGKAPIVWSSFPEGLNLKSFEDALCLKTDLTEQDLSRLLDCPFKIFPAFHGKVAIPRKKYKSNDNIATHFYQVAGAIYAQARAATNSFVGVPEWTHIRDNAIYLNVNNIDTAKSTAEDIACVWMEETLLIDATYGNGSIADFDQHPGRIIDWADNHNSMFLYEIMNLIRCQEAYLHDYLLRDVTPSSAMRFISQPEDAFCDGLVENVNPDDDGKADILYEGVPNWFIKSKYNTEYVQTVIERNWRHVVVVGAAKRIARGEFKPAKLFQWLASLGRMNCKVIFLD